VSVPAAEAPTLACRSCDFDLPICGVTGNVLPTCSICGAVAWPSCQTCGYRIDPVTAPIHPSCEMETR